MLDGGKASIEVGVFAVLISALIAVPLGCLAGFYGGKVDAVISRADRVGDGVPAHLLPRLRDRAPDAHAASDRLGARHPGGRADGRAPDRRLHVVLSTAPRARAAPHAAERRVRRLRPAWSAHRALRIIRKDLLPHLVPTLLVWGAVAVATDMLLEVGLSVIGVGVQASTATWGTLLAQTTGHDLQRGLQDARQASTTRRGTPSGRRSRSSSPSSRSTSCRKACAARSSPGGAR